LIDIKLLPILFCGSLAGAILPDLDSDTGTPFQIVIGLFSLMVGGLTFYFFFNAGEKSLLTLIGGPILAFIAFRIIVGSIFKKMTVHRGIFHSTPAGLIATLSVILLLNDFSLTPVVKVLIGISVGLGYVSHLILDEVYSAINFHGIPFIPNKSLGSALKLYSKSKTASLMAYIILGILIYFTHPIIQKTLVLFN